MSRGTVDAATSDWGPAPYNASIPASQVRDAGDGTVLFGGQIALQLLGGDVPPFEDEAACALANCSVLLAEHGLGWSDVVRMTVYLTDLEDRPALDELLRATLDEPFPVRSVVEVRRLARDAAVELELTATRGAGGTTTGGARPR
jgi:2-iminobutanoate/2-iminopropanoate deaminase